MNRTILFILFFSLLVKLQGQINWDFTYGDSTTTDEGWCIKQTFDGGFIVTGSTMSFEAEENQSQIILLKIAADGCVWEDGILITCGL